MNVLFVYSLEDGLLKNGLLDSQKRMQFGISYISSLLKKYGHYTDLIILSRLFGRNNIAVLNEYINKFDPKVICFSAVATEYDLIMNMARYIKRHYPDIYLLGGGIHITLNTESALSDDFDALCVGEGEYPALELVQQLENGKIPSGISNLWIRHGAEIEKNPPRCFLEDLDSLPFPDRIMWQKWTAKKDPEICSILLSRGCPFSCTYCCNHALRTISQGKYVRYRTTKNIIEEIRALSLDFPTIKGIYLENETIAANKDWCIELCSELEFLNATARRPLSFGVNIRVAPHIDLERIFSAFKKADFRFVNIGLESGSERVRREILRRNYSNEDIINAVKCARRYGLQIAIYNLIGIPGETLEDFKETIRINRICKPDRHFTSIFYPYPGTDLYLLCKKQGLLPKIIDPSREREKAVLDLPGFSRKEIQESYLFFSLYICKGLKPSDSLLIRNFMLFTDNFIYAFYKLLVQVLFLKYLPFPIKNFLKNQIRKLRI
jgi:anaerobic magnesium-protoporphyrin IX monomethyl ester cyclase